MKFQIETDSVESAAQRMMELAEKAKSLDKKQKDSVARIAAAMSGNIKTALTNAHETIAESMTTSLNTFDKLSEASSNYSRNIRNIDEESSGRLSAK